MAAVFYARVSTADQTLDHQRCQAEQAGFRFDHVIADHGVSGVSTLLRDRPNGRRLFDLLRAGDLLVVRWVDRLGRNYRDVTDVVREFMNRGVRIKTVINGMEFDGATTEPVQQALRDAMLAFMAAMAQAQAEATKEAQRAGIAHAREKNGAVKYRGRKPTYTWDSFRLAQTLIEDGAPITTIAKTTGIKRQSLHRIRKNPVGAEAGLRAWYGEPEADRV